MKQEIKILKKLRTPIQIQEYLDTVPINFEEHRETYMSVRRTLQEKKMHCLEGALVAATALWLQGQKPLLLDLKADGDDDHVVVLYRTNGYFGAISKTNHATLRFRDPIYKTLRELALSYFHEYTHTKNGKKCLRSYSTRPFDLRTLGHDWITSDEDLYYIAQAIDDASHTRLFPKQQEKYLRKADQMERRANALTEWRTSRRRA
ncbi:MAG: hypothetical protein MUD00_02485 [Candidatus Pacebacteria bacterium]|nr:hypothetical protein [Candidatus Paceibacterota bacterium]